MPNATVRANARPMPKPKPGSVASIRRQTANLKSATALLKAAKVVEHELAEPVAPSGDFEASQAVSRAYARWLKARAAIKSDFPEDKKAMQALYKDERAATRALFSLPAAYPDDVWEKIGALETELLDEQVVGTSTDLLVSFAIGCIKSDLLSLGIGRGDDRRHS